MMAYKLDPMDLKQIITLHIDGLSNRAIGEQLGISRNTVNTYMKYFKASEVSLKTLLKLENHELTQQFPITTTIKNERYNTLMRYFETVNKARAHPGFTFQYHHRQYLDLYPEGYGYTQFMEHYNRQFKKINGSLKLEHEAGKEVYIDFAGKKLYLTSKATGELIPVEVFLAVLPHSQYTYVEACASQKRADLIACMGRALAFFGGVPKAIVSDNLKSAVKRASKYEADINRSFKEFAQHYNCVVNPTRAYAPQDKALVENAVSLSYQRIYHPLREMIFFSLEEINQEIRKHLNRYNDLLFQRKDTSRKEQFQSVERQYLKPLPSTAFQLKDYCKAKVQKMGCVYFSPDKNYYSVPYRYIGKSTLIHYTHTQVEVYHNNSRIALHARDTTRGKYIYNKNHLSSQHKAYSEWSPDYFQKKAAKLGPHVEALVKAIFTNRDYPELDYKRALGIIQLKKDYDPERLDKACEKIYLAGSTSYHRVKNILKNNRENTGIDLEQLNASQSHIPEHENTRGAEYYN